MTHTLFLIWNHHDTRDMKVLVCVVGVALIYKLLFD